MALLDWILHLEYRCALPLAARLPRSAAYQASDLRSAWMRRRNRASRLHAEANLAKTFPSLHADAVSELARRYFKVQSRDELESFWYRRPKSFFDPFVKVKGLEVLQSAIKEGRGVLFYSGHLGSTGLFFVVMGLHGVRLQIIGRSLDPEENQLHHAILAYAAKRVRKIEEAVKAPFTLTGRGNFPKMLQMVSRGEVLLILPDVVPTLLKRTVPVTFFGRTARWGDGIAALYKATQAKLVEWGIHQDLKTGIHSIEVLDPELEHLRSEPNQRIIQELATRIESRIRRHPEDWSQWDSLEHFFPRDDC